MVPPETLCQSILPLVGNAFEVRPDLFERLQPELEQVLASNAYAVHDTGALQYSKMLGDRLCRVSVEPFASREIDCGGPLDSFPMSDSRVSSPKAAKTDARSLSSARRLRAMLDMALNIRHLCYCSYRFKMNKFIAKAQPFSCAYVCCFFEKTGNGSTRFVGNGRTRSTTSALSRLPSW